MIALAGGEDIRCAEYATFGTHELSMNIVKALKDRKACLMSNHGQVAFGDNLSKAFIRISGIRSVTAALDSGSM